MQEILSSIPTPVFYAVFISQILIFSHYTHKMLKRIKYVAVHYPPTTHPKLYPNISIDDAKIKVKKGLRLFKFMNISIFIIGCTLVIAAMMTGYEPLGNGEEDFVALYAILQFSPLIILEISSFKHFKMMRNANEDSTRKADLQPRHFFDFIAIPIFCIAALMFIASIAFELYIGETFFLIITLFVVHIYFAILIIWNLHGKKLDPHLASKDRIKQISLIIKTSVFTSIGISIFFMSDSAVDYFNLDYLDPLIISIYFQAIAIVGIGTIFRTTKIEDFDFDVYKSDAAA